MIKVYSGFKGLAVTFFFVAGVILFFSILFWGITKATELLLPLLIVLAYMLISVFLLALIPAAFLKDLRPSLGVYTTLMSHALGVVTWMVSFFFVIKNFGAVGIFFALLFQFLAPIAIIGAMFKGYWVYAGDLSIWIVFTYGMRFYSQWLVHLNSPKQAKSRIIDVDAVEVRDH